ncbi:MAG: HAD family hydrolase [Gemmatimonadota bacterium]
MKEGRSGGSRAAPSHVRYPVVVFDYDGVLADSLGPHLDFLREVACDLGIEPRVPVPDADAFKRRWVDTQNPDALPLEDFMHAAGFMEEAEPLFERYVDEFGDRPVPLFEGALDLLEGLREEGVRLGIVTANHTAVVRTQLGPHFDLLEPGWFYGADSGPGQGKAWAIEEILVAAGIAPTDMLFVGDQWSDAIAARDAGVDFLAVSYGWGLDAGHVAHRVVHAASEIRGVVVG